MSGWMARLKSLFEAYGPVALAVWLTLFGLTWAAFYVAFQVGFELEGVTAQAGLVAAAYAATQLVKPLRILLTAVLTPLVAHALGRRPKEAPPARLSETDSPEACSEDK